jgi:membrane dipeptidase
MLIFDAHLDIALNAIDWNRDYRQEVRDINTQEVQLGMTELGRGGATTSFPELNKAGVTIGIATVLARREIEVNHGFGYTTYEACYAVAMSHLAYYRAVERSGWMKPIRTKGDLAAAVEPRLVDPYRGPFAYILSMECGDAVLDPDHIHEWFEQGLRAIGITHYGTNRYGGGTRSEVGLTAEALPLLKNIQQLGMALDMTHLSDRAFWQVTEVYGGRVLASHQAARRFCDWQRQFSDAQLRWVIDRDGVIGMPFDAIMLQPGWVRGVTKAEVTMERVVDNVDHICQLAGNTRHVGIGSDLDGGYGNEQTPADVKTITALAALPELLTRRGYSSEDVRGILHGNFIRFFGEVLPG